MLTAVRDLFGQIFSFCFPKITFSIANIALSYHLCAKATGNKLSAVLWLSYDKSKKHCVAKNNEE